MYGPQARFSRKEQQRAGRPAAHEGGFRPRIDVPGEAALHAVLDIGVAAAQGAGDPASVDQAMLFGRAEEAKHAEQASAARATGL
jgi:hypothetical protein